MRTSGISLTTASYSAHASVLCDGPLLSSSYTPVVRAQQFRASFLLLLVTQTMFLVLCCHGDIGRPQLWTCQLRHAGIWHKLCLVRLKHPGQDYGGNSRV